MSYGVSVLLSGCSSDEKVLFQSKTYTLSHSGVAQGPLAAEVVSADEIRSNYFNHPRDIIFKFAVNGGDNEQGVGVDHAVMLYPTAGKVTLPVITFGTKLSQLDLQPERGDFLEPNTEVHFKVDMRPVLQTIQEKGVFKAWNGDEIKEIRSLAIVGSREPLGWDFSEAHTKADRQLTDENGDGIFETTVIFNKSTVEKGSRIWKRSADVSAYPTYSSGILMTEALYNLALEELEKNKTPDGLFDTGAQWKGVWTRDVSYSIVLSLAYLQPEIAKACLRKKVKDGKIIQDTGTGGSWPVSSDRLTWALAAWEIFSVTGEETWLREVYPIIKKSLDDDFHTIYSENGLVKGETSFADWREQSYPRWMQPVDIYASEAADNAAVHIRSLDILAEMAAFLNEPKDAYSKRSAELKQRFNDTFWLENEGWYAQFLYGQPFPVRSPRAMALAEAFPILFDIAPSERWNRILSAPVTPYGVPTFHPQIPDVPAYHNNSMWPFVQAFWNLANAKAKHEVGLAHGLGAMFRAGALFLTNKENLRADNGNDYKTAINSDRQLWSVAGQLGMYYKVFAGMQFDPRGIWFQPAIPKSFGATHEIKNFRYRNMTLDIIIKGYGSDVSTFTVNGVQSDRPFLSALLEGKQTVEIVMDNKRFNKAGNPNEMPVVFSLETPQVSPEGLKLTWPDIDGALTYAVYRNGAEVAEVDLPEYSIKPGNALEIWQIQARHPEKPASFLSAPLELIGEESEFWIEAESMGAKSATVSKGFRGKGYVTLSKKENKSVSFQLKDIPAGRYRVDFRYANGNGPINTENKCAIRTLRIDGAEAGSVVMPQRGSGSWENWGFSNAFILQITGNETLTLSFEPWNENMHGETNEALLDAIRFAAVDTKENRF